MPTYATGFTAAAKRARARAIRTDEPAYVVLHRGAFHVTNDAGVDGRYHTARLFAGFHPNGTRVNFEAQS